jgi:hypothetical protein
MKKKIYPVVIRFILIGMLLIGNSLGFAQGGKPTSPETKARMLQLINTLEKEPFHKDAKA